jgi:hypothetical protein
MHIYENTAHCFVCGAHCPVEDVLSGVELKKYNKQHKYSFEETMEYISCLPVKEVRGLMLPVNTTGFYVVWPDKSYYKKRLYIGKNRYIGPPGMKPPLLKLGPQKAKSMLWVIEGELNALSFNQCYPNEDVVSPGSATELLRHIEFYLTFPYISVIVDKDDAGVAHGVILRDELAARGKLCNLIAVKKDFNDVLQEKGKARAKEKYLALLGMYGLG